MIAVHRWHRSQATGHDPLHAALEIGGVRSIKACNSNSRADRLLAAPAFITPPFLALTRPSTVTSSKQDGSSEAFIHSTMSARLG